MAVINIYLLLDESNPKSLCYIFNSPSSLLVEIILASGVYPPTYFIARKALFYICVQLYYFQLYICIINILDICYL